MQLQMSTRAVGGARKSLLPKTAAKLQLYGSLLSDATKREQQSSMLSSKHRGSVEHSQIQLLSRKAHKEMISHLPRKPINSPDFTSERAANIPTEPDTLPGKDPVSFNRSMIKSEPWSTRNITSRNKRINFYMNRRDLAES